MHITTIDSCLTMVIVFSDHSAPQYESYIVVASSPANIGVCMEWGRWLSWVTRHEPKWGNIHTYLLSCDL